MCNERIWIPFTEKYQKVSTFLVRCLTCVTKKKRGWTLQKIDFLVQYCLRFISFVLPFILHIWKLQILWFMSHIHFGFGSMFCLRNVILCGIGQEDYAIWSNSKIHCYIHIQLLLKVSPCHEFHETCHSVTFIVLVNSHQKWKQTRNRVCFHLWCELTLALWCHSIVWSLFSWNKMTILVEFLSWVALF